MRGSYGEEKEEEDMEVERVVIKEVEGKKDEKERELRKKNKK